MQYKYDELLTQETAKGFKIKHYHSDTETMSDMITFVKTSVPLVRDKFIELENDWFYRENTLVKRQEPPHRTPDEVCEELLSIVTNSSAAYQRNNGTLDDWTISTLCFEKYNKIIKQGFQRLNRPDLYNAFCIEWLRKV